jgi:hypothetical protein
MVETRGKRGWKVPIILTPELKTRIDLINSLRSAVGINEKNPYVFAQAYRDSVECLRGWDCLRYSALECEPKLQNPGAITSTKLRKYIATIMQVLSLKEQEIDWLARHLGHDIRTHREYYRLHESTIEIAKVSKLLLAVDRPGELIGKSLDEIDIDGKIYAWLKSTAVFTMLYTKFRFQFSCFQTGQNRIVCRHKPLCLLHCSGKGAKQVSQEIRPPSIPPSGGRIS